MYIYICMYVYIYMYVYLYIYIYSAAECRLQGTTVDFLTVNEAYKMTPQGQRDILSAAKCKPSISGCTDFDDRVCVL